MRGFRTIGAALLIILPLTSNAAIGSRAVDIPLQSDFEIDPTPMTTDQAWMLDSDVQNPQRQRWVVQRQLEIRGLEAFPLGKKGFGVRASGLASTVRLHLRGPGPWYRAFEEFPCTKEPQDWFATVSGANLAGMTAADLWIAEIEAARSRLTLAMERMQGDTEEEALGRGQRLYQLWLRGVEQDWRARTFKEVPIVEWRSYQKTARSEGLCASGREKSVRSHPRWEEIMEPPITSKSPPQILARAPARRWDGLFSIRVIIAVADKRLDGKFLVDTESEQSLISPDWLIAQGVNPRLLGTINAPLEKIVWAGEAKLAKRVEVEATFVGDTRIPLTQFYVRQTDLFERPDNVASCCDGVLGRNFLKNYAVEFRPGSPSEIILYKAEGFNQGKDAIWIEVESAPNRGLSSDCIAQAGSLKIPGVFWDTGSDVGLELYAPWAKSARGAKGAWSLACGSEPIATHLERDMKTATSSGRPQTLGKKSPGATIGMPVLGRGPFTVDLAHGRIWMAKSGLNARILRDDSGLKVKFVDEDGDRVLRVVEVKMKGPSAELIHMGLKRGQRLAEIDGKAAEEMDLWDVEQHLAGVYGSTVMIKWKTPKGVKIAALKLR